MIFNINDDWQIYDHNVLCFLCFFFINYNIIYIITLFNEIYFVLLVKVIYQKTIDFY